MKRTWLNADQAAEFLGIQKSTLYAWTHKGQIPFYRIGGKRLAFVQQELESFILDNRCGLVRTSQGVEIES